MKRYSRIFTIILTITLIFTQTSLAQKDLQSRECFMILAGKDATNDGSVLVAHNNDLTGIETSFIQKITRQKHDPAELVSFPSGLKIPQVNETYEWMVLQIESGYAEGDAIAINEYQVSIAGGVALGQDRNEMAKRADPLIKNGLTGGVRYVALERTKTARGCVEMIGSLYTKYGVTYPSGVAVADPEEIWYIEAGGGHTWAAVRVPDDSFMAIANGYRIGKIDVTDTANVLTSPHLLKFADENSLWIPAEGNFNFAKAFGGGRENRFYDTRRVWRGISQLASQDFSPDEIDFPMFNKPKNKISIQILMDLLRDKYENTPFEFIPSERTICIHRTVHSSIVQLRHWLPVEIGAVLWASLSVPSASIYVPFYFGIGEVNPAFIKTSKDDSAFWKFRSLFEKTIASHELASQTSYKFGNIESKIFKVQYDIETTALESYKYDGNQAIGILTYFVNGLCEIALDETIELLTK